MKMIIASDIHGSAYYCEKLLCAYRAQCADKLLLLGDILYHGPRNDLPRDYAPKAVIGMLNGIDSGIICVRGNCDTEVDQMVLDFPILADYAVIADEFTTMYATHGHIYHPQNLPKISGADVLLYGHTHIPKCETVGDVVCINPGSVSIPKENSHHGYILYENGLFLWMDFDGNTVDEYRR